jgi:hypothetical protein
MTIAAQFLREALDTAENNAAALLQAAHVMLKPAQDLIQPVMGQPAT